MLAVHTSIARCDAVRENHRSSTADYFCVGGGDANRGVRAIARTCVMTDARIPDRDVIADAQARFNALANYQVTLESSAAGARPIAIRYSYRKPGFVRMDCIRPHAGTTVVYSPETGKATLWPFGFGRLPKLEFSPDNPLIKSAQGHRIDQSDLGVLLVNVRELQRHGDTQVVGVQTIGMRRALHVIVTRSPGQRVAGVCRYELWFDVGLGLPVRAASEGVSGEPIETVLMEDLRIDVPESQLGPFS